MDWKNGHFSHLSSATFKADAEIAFQFPLLRQCLQGFQVAGADVFTRLEFNRRVIAQDKIYFKAGLGFPKRLEKRLVTTLSSNDMSHDDFGDTGHDNF